jgi:hypothetical protein
LPGRDLFLSYASKDKAFAKKLAGDLTGLGVKVWIDLWEMKVGDSINRKIQSGISESSWLGIILSPNSVNSPWVEKELSAALTKELEEKEVFVLPILYADCKIPLFLRDKVYADFRSSYGQGLEALLGRVKPTLEPKVLQALMSEKDSAILGAYSRIRAEDRGGYGDALVEKLNSSSVGDRLAAMTALFAIRNKDLSAHLLRMTKDPSPSVRRRAIFSLGELRAKYAVGVVSESLSDGSPDVRAAARDAYRKITGKSS